MKKTWKWILGILIVLVVATLVATPFVLRSALGAGFSANLPARAWMRNPGADNLPRDFDGGPGLMPRNWQRNNPRSFGGDFGHMSPRMGGGFSRFGGHTFLSSTTVREIAMLDGDISSMVPPHVEAALKRKLLGMSDIQRPANALRD